MLIRQLDQGQQTFAMLVDFGHDCLIRDDTPMSWTPGPKGSTPETSCTRWG